MTRSKPGTYAAVFLSAALLIGLAWLVLHRQSNLPVAPPPHKSSTPQPRMATAPTANRPHVRASRSGVQTLSRQYDIHVTVCDCTPDVSDERLIQVEQAVLAKDRKLGEKAYEGMLARMASNVVVTAQGASVRKDGVTDAKGKFTFMGLPAGTYELTATMPLRPSGTIGERSAIAVAQVNLTTNREVGLKFDVGTLTVRGRITDALGRPVAGAKVTGIPDVLRPRSVRSDIVTNLSDAAGFYELKGLAPPNVNDIARYYLTGPEPTIDADAPSTASFYLIVRVEAEGFVQTKENVPRFPLLTEELLVPARRLMELWLKLAPAIGAFSEEEWRKAREKSQRLVLPTSQGNTIAGIDIVLDRSAPGAQVSGILLDTKGQAVPGRVLEFILNSTNPPLPGADYVEREQRLRQARTDGSGAFVVRNLGAGKYSVSVHGSSVHDGILQEPVRGRRFEVGPGENVEGFEIVINPAGDYAISGHVRDVRGKPVCGVRVFAWVPHHATAWCKTDANGAYRLQGLDTYGMSLFRVLFYAHGQNGFALEVPNVPLNAENVDLGVPDKGSLHGVVRHASTGESVTNYQVTVPVLNLPDGSTGHDHRGWVSVRRNPDASFSISGIRAGEAIIEVRAPGLGTQRFPTMVEAGTTNSLVCAMRGSAILEGVTTVNGRPQPVHVKLNDDTTYSGKDGRYRFDRQPNGDYTVLFSCSEYGKRHAQVRLVSGETTRLDMDLAASCEVRGAIVFAGEEEVCVRLSSKPVSDGWAEGEPGPDEWVLGTSRVKQSGGQYRLCNIPPGRYYLMVARKHNSYWYRLTTSMVIELEEGDSLPLDLDLTKPEPALQRSDI